MENTSDSFMPGSLLFCIKSKKSVCYSVADNTCHNLRHTFATRYCENETNLKVIQEIMGHKDIATTMEIYAEATKEAKVKSFEDLCGKIKIS